MLVNMQEPFVLVVTDSLEHGGTETHILTVYRELRHHSIDVAVIPLLSGGALASFYQASNLLPYGYSEYPLLNLFNILRVIVSRRPILHLFLPRSYIILGLISLFVRPAFTLASRRSRNFYQLRHPLMARLEHFLHKHIGLFLGNSIQVCQDLISEGVPQQNVRLIYNGTDIQPTSDHAEKQKNRTLFRRVNGLPSNKLLVVCVANFYPYKGHNDLLRAISQLGETFTSNASLLLVGRDSGSLPSVRGLINELGLNTSVLILGERSDVSDILRSCDIGVLASHEEGFSNSVLEGMASGLPMVVTDVGGNAEAVVPFQTGFVVPPHNPSLLADALLQLIQDEHLRQTMGDSALKRIKDHFSITSCVGSYHSLYLELWGRISNA